MTITESDNYNRHFPVNPSSRLKYCPYCDMYVPPYDWNSHIITTRHRKRVEQRQHPILKENK